MCGGDKGDNALSAFTIQRSQLPETLSLLCVSWCVCGCVGVWWCVSWCVCGCVYCGACCVCGGDNALSAFTIQRSQLPETLSLLAQVSLDSCTRGSDVRTKFIGHYWSRDSIYHKSACTPRTSNSAVVRANYCKSNGAFG